MDKSKIKKILFITLSNIGDVVGCDYRSEVFTMLYFPGDDFAHRGSGGPSAKRGGTAALNSSVHISLIVEANIDESMAPLHSPTYELKPDIISSPVASKSDKSDISLLDLAFFAQNMVGCLNAGYYRGYILEGDVNPGDTP